MEFSLNFFFFSYTFNNAAQPLASVDVTKEMCFKGKEKDIPGHNPDDTNTQLQIYMPK